MHVRDTAALPSEESPSATASKGGDARESIVLLASRLGMGGAERHTISLANLLSRDFRVVVAYLKPEEDMIGQLHRQSLAELRCLHAQSRFDLRAARELAELAQAHDANMIVCANAFSLMYAQLAKSVSPHSLIVMEIFHTTKLRTLREHLEMLFYRPFFWAAQHLVFVCNGQRRYWRRRGLWAGQTHMIYNGVDVSHFDPARYDGAIRQTRDAFGFGIADHLLFLRIPRQRTSQLQRIIRQNTACRGNVAFLNVGNGTAAVFHRAAVNGDHGRVAGCGARTCTGRRGAR